MFSFTSCLAFAAGLALTAGTALAQQTKPAAQPAPQAAPGQGPSGPVRAELVGLGDWVKVCGKDQVAQKEVCYTTRDFGQAADQQPVLAMAVYDVKGEKQRILRMLMPVGLMLRPGFRYALDKGAALSGTFEICFPNGCFAESKIEAPTVEAMKKATGMTVQVQNQGGNEVNFSLQLAGFGKAFDGAPIDPKVIEEQQKLQQQKLDEDLRKKAEELKAQEAAPAPAAPKP